MKTKRISKNQARYIAYIERHPGCSIADVDRACRINKRAGHKWIYDSVNRLIRRKLIARTYKAGRTVLKVA